MKNLHLAAGTAGEGADPVVITPAVAGWTFSGLRVMALGPGERRQLHTGEFELAVLPLAGGCRVEVDGKVFDMTGRDSVWSGISDFAYVPRDAEMRISSHTGGEFALPMARATRRLDPAYGPAEGVPVEVRGAGQATRSISNFLNPEAFEADKLIAVEVYTPEGNWSSYPPHKHDGLAGSATGCDEAVLEEIYYFRIHGTSGFGLHRTYAADGGFDETVKVGDGDVFLVPHGFHGPCVAPPGYHMYYLNVLAGPADERSMAFCTDPAHQWIWEAWKDVAQDPRCPLVTVDRGIEATP